MILQRKAPFFHLVVGWQKSFGRVWVLPLLGFSASDVSGLFDDTESAPLVLGLYYEDESPIFLQILSERPFRSPEMVTLV